jgi:hypothetical protein
MQAHSTLLSLSSAMKHTTLRGNLRCSSLQSLETRSEGHKLTLAAHPFFASNRDVGYPYENTNIPFWALLRDKSNQIFPFYTVFYLCLLNQKKVN